jgi:hypothetical protein
MHHTGSRISAEVPDLLVVQTTRFEAKLWVSPRNEFVSLRSLHFEYFRDQGVSEAYGIPLTDETSTRLAALSVGFVRVNYRRNGGLLTVETMRWDASLARTIDHLIAHNRAALDRVRFRLVDGRANILHQREFDLLDQLQKVPLFVEQPIPKPGGEASGVPLRSTAPHR